MYHRISNEVMDPWGLVVHPSNFDEQLHVLRRTRYPMSLADFVSRLSAGTLPDAAAVITFDDGYVDNLVNAKPRLDSADVSAVVFLATGYIGRQQSFWWDELTDLVLAQQGNGQFALTVGEHVMVFELGPDYSASDYTWRACDPPRTSRQSAYMLLWNKLRVLTHDVRLGAIADLRRTLPDGRQTPSLSRPMNLEEVRHLSSNGLIAIGAHTATHPLLPALDLADCNREILESKAFCDAILTTGVPTFAYPYGEFNPEVKALVRRAGFVCACSTSQEPVRFQGGSTADLYALPRIQIQNWSGDEFEMRLESVCGDGRIAGFSKHSPGLASIAAKDRCAIQNGGVAIPESHANDPLEDFQLAGVKLEIPASFLTATIRQSLLDGWYENDEVSQALDLVRPGDVVLELGAGLGFTSAKIARHPHVDRLVAVEADTRMAAVARRTYNLSSANVELITAVIAGSDGEVSFNIAPEILASSLFPMEGGTSIRLPAISLKPLLQLVEPSVLIVDIEGSEAFIFDGGSLPYLRHIVLQVHPGIIGLHGLARTFAALTRAGFECENSINSKVLTFRRTPVRCSDDNDLELLAVSDFFDSNWYSARYLYEEGAEPNPIRHYLEVGAAEGYNPSPMFDTRWYEAQNPDVGASRMNPLVHYLRIGAARGSEPHPFAALKQKIVPAGEEVDQILAASSRERQLPDAADDANWAENRTIWADYFMSEGSAALSRADLLAALLNFQHAVQVCPEERKGWVLYAHAFRSYNHRALAGFEDTFSAPSLVVAHVSCARLIDKARLSAETFTDSKRRVESLIVIGNDDPDERRFHFDPARRVLVVPTGDVYESLPMKVSRLFLFLGFSSLSHHVLKVDDDVQCSSVEGLNINFNKLMRHHDYGGQLVALPLRLNDCRFWHFRKCSDAAVDLRPDGLLFAEPFARGAYYWLSPKAVTLLSKAILIHSRYFEIETLEDRAVGLVLSYYGIRPQRTVLTDLKRIGRRPGWSLPVAR